METGAEMQTIGNLIEATIKSEKRYRYLLIVISFVWYLALFPGRLGFDYSEAIRIMQRGQSTDWWTSSFWWFLKISSFNGQTIVISSGLCLLILGYSIFYLSESLESANYSNRKALVILFCSPLYGGFGLNISHDVFVAAAIIIFTGFHIRVYRRKDVRSNADLLTLTLAGVLAITTHYGPYFVATNFVLLIAHKYLKAALSLTTGTIIIATLANLGITHVPTYGLVLPVIADLKCVAQHPDAEILQTEWATLTALAPKAEWMNPTKCSIVDDSFRAMPSLDLNQVKLSKNLIQTYLGVSGRNSAIVAMAHIQRASIALPPPFFSGPPNQVNLNPSIPIGEGTNTALQSNAGVLHPSIDEPTVTLKVPILKILEIPAQGLIFIVNQASWFWGWGGLWLWPIIVYIVLYLKLKYRRSVVAITATTFVLHGLLLILSAPLPRYVMSTILLGNYLLLIMVIDGFSKIFSRREANI